MPGSSLKLRVAAATGLALAASLAAVGSASAHHSFAMFDRQKQETVKGTVKEFQFTNPHVFIQLLVPNTQGVVQEWSIEAGSPNMLYRQGWAGTTFKAGDKITVVVNPLRDGGHGGNFVSATLPDGKTVGNQAIRPPG